MIELWGRSIDLALESDRCFWTAAADLKESYFKTDCCTNISQFYEGTATQCYRGTFPRNNRQRAVCFVEIANMRREERVDWMIFDGWLGHSGVFKWKQSECPFKNLPASKICSYIHSQKKATVVLIYLQTELKKNK